MWLELIRDWETPLRTFHKGHFNPPKVWANILGISVSEFNACLLGGQFANWFKVLETHFRDEKP